MHYAVIDLAYGDSGKGILTSRLCATRDIDWVIRTSGGCQAAHNVITDDGRHHTFAQFGSGTFSGVKTFLSKYMMVEPFALINEAQALAKLGVSDPLKMVTIDPDALLTTPYHWELNCWEETMRMGVGKRHGSTGRGIGMTALFNIQFPTHAPRIGDIGTVRLRVKLNRLRNWVESRGCPSSRLPRVEELVNQYEEILDQLKIMKMSWGRILDQDQVVFEGAQGVLLDEDYGFHPHTTWTKTTDHNVHAFMRDAGHSDTPLTVLGVVRSYATRHGAGPFITYNDLLPKIEKHNKHGHYQGDWQQGYTDLVALKYAIDVCERIDYLYVTHTDVPDEFMGRACISYTDKHTYENVKLEVLPVDALAARESQTEALKTALPVYVPMDFWRPAESLSEALAVPLYGKGWGPKIGDGVIQWA